MIDQRSGPPAGGPLIATELRTMHYLFNGDQILSSANSFRPDAPFSWRNGIAVSFHLVSLPSFSDLTAARIVSPAGDGWHLQLSADTCLVENGVTRVAAVVLQRITGAREVTQAIVAHAHGHAGGLVRIDSSNYLPGELERVALRIVLEGGRAVVDFALGYEMEAILRPDGTLSWKRYREG